MRCCSGQILRFAFLAVTNCLRRWKVYGPDLNGQFGGLQGTGGLEATILDSGGTTQGVINDQFGNGVASVTGGVATWFATRVGAYGPLPGTLAATLTDITQLAAATAWRGRRIDPTGFYDLGARYYEPTSGRFLSADPMGQAASPSLYDFANGDPVNFFDPDGRFGGTPLTAGEYFSAIGSGLLTGVSNVGYAAVTAPYRFGTTVVSGYQQIGGLAGDALTGSLNSDVNLMASHPINTLQATGQAAVQTVVQIGAGVAQQAQTSQGLANLSADLAFGLLSGSAGLQTLNEGAPTSIFWTGSGTRQAATNLANSIEGQTMAMSPFAISGEATREAISSGSAAFAGAAQGDVMVVQVENLPPVLGSTFVASEYPAILNNSNVPNIIYVSVDQAGNVVSMVSVPNEIAQLAYIQNLTAFVTGDAVAAYSQNSCPNK